MNKYFGKVMDDKIIFNKEAFFKLIEETKEESIELGKQEAQAEIARLQKQVSDITSEWTETCAENSRLKEESKHAYHIGVSHTIAEFAPKIDRLREALEHISTLGNMFEERASAQVAREALKGKE